jgi:hypothetical protein
VLGRRCLFLTEGLKMWPGYLGSRVYTGRSLRRQWNWLIRQLLGAFSPPSVVRLLGAREVYRAQSVFVPVLVRGK